MRKSDIEAENSRLKKELSRIQKENGSLFMRLEKYKQKTFKLQTELKKKDVRIIVLNKEQAQSFSSLLTDTAIANLLYG
jgi:inorganic pyrophosphatase/exopolyphosphatase